MAASNVFSAQWTVVVVVEENPSLNKTFQKSPDTKLFDLVLEWKGECGVLGNWIFKSIDKRTTYNDYSMTLEMVGETVPLSQMVNLKAESIDEPALLLFREIFVNMNEKCHRLFVTPDEKVGEVLWRLPERPSYLEFNGEPLNAKHTVKEAGLQDKSVLYQRLCSVSVKLSSGYSKIFQMPLDSLVWHLIERINVFETEEFSLKYEGRFLKTDEEVRHLTKTVEVRRVEFVVNVDGRRVSWGAKEEPIPVSDFLPQLMAKGEMDARRLEELEFVCVGCQRRVRNSKDDIQFLPVECCGERSMTLDAMVPSETRPNYDRNDLTKHIQVLQELLEHSRLQDSCVEGSRCVCRDLKQKFAAEGLDYNVLTQHSQNLLRRISDLEDKIRKSNVVIEASEKEIGRLQTENLKIKEENKELVDKTKNLDKKKKDLVDKNKNLDKENKELVDKNKNLDKENKDLVHKNKNLDKENRELVDKNKNLDKEKKDLVNKNKNLDKEKKDLVHKNKNLDKENKELVSQMKDPKGATAVGPLRLPAKQLGVKLFVLYDPDDFSPVAGRRELQSRGQYLGTLHFIRCQDLTENTDFEGASGPQRVEKLNRFRRLYHIGVRGNDVSDPIRNFSQLVQQYGLDERLLQFLDSKDFREPTPVQRQAIPLMLEGREVLVCAPTGSGKTLAFLIPLIHHIQQCRKNDTETTTKKRPLRAIVLSPTIELAMQTLTQCQELVTHLGVVVKMEDCSSTLIRLQQQLKNKEKRLSKEYLERLYRKYDKKMRRLRRELKNVDILISTPKRLIDTMKTGVINLRNVEWLVLDEADRLFDDELGCLFRDQIAEIFKACTSPKIKRAMFSATTRPDVDEWARFTFDNVVSVRVGKRNAAVTSVNQSLTYCGQEAGKLHEIRMLLVRGLKYPCLVFLQSRDRARLLHEEMKQKNVRAGIISGDKSQNQRGEVMKQFRAGEILVLICTDLISRGIDIPDVKMVVNYDLPPTPLEYVHRVGRTGRAGREGAAITLWTDDDFDQLRPIAHLIRESGGTIPGQLNELLRKKKRQTGQAARKLSIPDRGDLRGYGRKRRQNMKGGRGGARAQRGRVIKRRKTSN